MQEASNLNQFLTFMLAGEEYGVDILRVQEIRGWDSVQEIPNTPDHVLGVLNIRGTVVSIIDLRKLFHLTQSDFGPTTVIVIVKVWSEEVERTVGMVVDAISDVYSVAEEDIHEAPDMGATIDIEYIRGLTTIDTKMMILLDIDLLINIGALYGVLEQDSDAQILLNRSREMLE